MALALGPRAAAAGYRLMAFDQAGSTNTEAMAHARQCGQGSTWFVTTEQTAGRGRRQRAWVAPRGNLASSVLEIMNITPAVAATMSFAFGLAHEAALRRLSVEASLRQGGSDQLNYLLKWPNDVLVGGKKLCGLMVEAEGMSDGRLAVVAGIGTNIIAAPEGTPTPAVSLAGLGVQISAEELFTAQSDAWVEYFGIWDNGRGFADIRKLWLERAYGVGGPVAIQTGTGTLEGTFDTIDETGCLIVRTADGRRMPVTAGEVFFGNAASVGAA